jgi:hypothetical protein
MADRVMLVTDDTLAKDGTGGAFAASSKRSIDERHGRFRVVPPQRASRVTASECISLGNGSWVPPVSCELGTIILRIVAFWIASWMSEENEMHSLKHWPGRSVWGRALCGSFEEVLVLQTSMPMLEVGKICIILGKKLKQVDRIDWMFYRDELKQRNGSTLVNVEVS